MVTDEDPYYRYIKIQFNANNIFHEKLSDDDPAGSKHVVKIHIKQIIMRSHWLFITNLLC
jgi:hypothetical protein